MFHLESAATADSHWTFADAAGARVERQPQLLTSAVLAEPSPLARRPRRAQQPGEPHEQLGELSGGGGGASIRTSPSALRV
jgi:hypothetical protein